jgi:hypothetical protein
MDQSRILALATISLLAGGFAAQAGPCTSQIGQLEGQIARLQAAQPASGVGEPTAPQSVGAQLHRQPTPGSVRRAEGVANADGDAAIERARQADNAGDATQCDEALREAKRLYGID